jgi:hypothetical protein
MVDNSLDALKGWMPGNMGSIDKAAKLSANVTIDPVLQGRVVHLNSEGEFEMGCTGHQMAIFLLQNSDDTDVTNSSDGGMWTPIVPKGFMTGLVAIGGYELADTAFDADQDYVYNDMLRAVASNSNATTGGRLTNQTITLFTNAVCGIVSKPPANNANAKSVICFWPVFCPGTD